MDFVYMFVGVFVTTIMIMVSLAIISMVISVAKRVIANIRSSWEEYQRSRKLHRGLETCAKYEHCTDCPFCDEESNCILLEE